MRDQRAQRRRRPRLVRHVVDIRGRPRHLDALADQRVAQRVDVVDRRIEHRRQPRRFGRAGENHAGHFERAAAQRPRQPQRAWERGIRGDRRGGRRDRHHVRAQRQPAAFRLEPHRRGLTGGGGGRDHHAHEVLVELQRAARRRGRTGEVVPHPAFAQRLIVEEIVVADDPPVDARDARRLQPIRPVLERLIPVRPSRAGTVPIAHRRIAVAGDDEVAFQHAARDRAARLHFRREPEVPPEPIRGDRHGDDFHVRRRHHEQVRVVLVEDFAGLERLNLDRPQRVHRRIAERLFELLLQPRDRRSRGGDDLFLLSSVAAGRHHRRRSRHATDAAFAQAPTVAAAQHTREDEKDERGMTPRSLSCAARAGLYFGSLHIMCAYISGA